MNSVRSLRWLHTVTLLLALAAFVPARAADEAAKPVGFAKWEKEISGLEAGDKTNAPPKNGIVFVGSSSIRMWKTLKQDFPDLPVLNRGFGGSEVADSVHFADRLVINYAPRQVVMYAGGNDLAAGKTPERVFSDFTNFVATVHAKLPKANIAYISIAGNPSRWKQVDKVKAANKLIEDFTKTDKRLDYIDVFTHMLGADGQPKPDIFIADKLHMNANGYAIWKEVVRPHLK